MQDLALAKGDRLAKLDGCVLKSMHSTTAEQLAGPRTPLFSMSTDEALKAISEFVDTQHK